MKKYFVFSLLFLSVSQMILLFSCKDEDQFNQEAKPNSLYDIIAARGSNNLSTDGDITVIAIDYLYGGDFPIDNFDITGYFKNSSGVGVPVSNFNVGGFNIPEQSNYRYTLHKGSVTPSDNIMQVASTFCGQEINYSVSSVGFGNVSTTLHMPAALNTAILSQSNTIINRSAPLQVNWQPDPYVVEGEDDETVGVAIVYHAGIPANQEQEGMPAQNITVYKQAVDASGTVTFSASDLAAFPLNSYVTIYCGRAYQKFVTSSTGRTLAITNLMLSTTLDMKIQ